MDSINIIEIRKLFENKMKINKKIIYDFHLQICFGHIEELIKTSKTIIKSGFIRNIIYEILKFYSISYKLKIVSYIKKRSLCRWNGGFPSNIFYTPNMMLGYIKSNRVLKDEFLESQNLKELNYPEYTKFGGATYEEINSLFNPEISNNEKYNIISNELDIKWNIFENCFLYRPVKQIILI